MSESHLCGHGYVYGCAECRNFRRQPQPIGGEGVRAHDPTEREATSEPCTCGHAKAMHPFGMSEALTFNGRCTLCNCCEFQPRVGDARPLAPPAHHVSYQWACENCRAIGIVWQEPHGAIWSLIIDAHRASSPDCQAPSLSQVHVPARQALEYTSFDLAIIRRQLEQRDQQVAELEATIAAGEAREAALQRQLEEARFDAKAGWARGDALQAERDAVTMTLVECQSMANWERKQRTEAEAAIVSLQADLEDSETDKSAAVHSAMRMNAQLSDLQAQLQAITQEMRGYIKSWATPQIDKWADALDAATKGQQ